MKKFITFLLGIIFLVIGILFVLDILYTKVYENAVPRTKFQYLRSLKNKKIDYIFLGSSRVENDIVPVIVKEKNGKNAINLGFQGAKLSDVYTILQLIKEYNISADKILIQVDYIYNIENGYSNVLKYELMPFIRENEVTREYFNLHFGDNKWMYVLPFYRYCSFEPKIGFREFFLNNISKKTRAIDNYGFVGLVGNSPDHKNSLPERINFKNIYFDKIKAFAKSNNMSIVYFCAPFCKHTKNLNFVKKLKEKIPELYDFSKAIENDKMFQNCSHLNKEGAYCFTEEIVNNMLK